MGKAVLALIEAKETITLETVIAKLRLMVEFEEDADKKRACELAMTDLLYRVFTVPGAECSG